MRLAPASPNPSGPRPSAVQASADGRHRGLALDISRRTVLGLAVDKIGPKSPDGRDVGPYSNPTIGQTIRLGGAFGTVQEPPDKREGVTMGRSVRRVETGVVLLDTTSPHDEAFDVSFLERNDHPVVVCHGPEADAGCPLVGGHGCEMFERAHGIVFQLDLDEPENRAILEKYRQLNAEIPIRVVVRPAQLERYRELLSRFEILVREPSAADLDGFAAEVEAADRSAG
jgi:hypothetical protein